MKKFVFASVMALASVNLVSSPLLRAQSQDLSIKDRASTTPTPWPVPRPTPPRRRRGWKTSSRSIHRAWPRTSS